MHTVCNDGEDVMSYVEDIAQRIVSYDARGMRDEMRSKLAACLLFNLSVGLAGWRSEDAVQRAFMSTHTSPGSAKVLVDGRSLSPADAAFVNAGLITARSQNDTHIGINGHIGCVVVPAFLGFLHEGEVSNADALGALAVGYETPRLVAQGIAGEVGKRGFRGTSIFALFGAVATSARMLGLDTGQTAHALAIASNFSGGLMQCWEEGTMEWRVQVAHASRAGVVAALLARQGMTGASRALEGDSGFYRAFAGTIPPLVLPAEFDEVMQVTFKPYPGCTINQPAVHAVLALLAEHALDSENIERVTLAMNPAQASYPGVSSHGPFGGEAGAVMSAPFMIELALENRALRRADFAAHYGADPVHARSARVVVDADPALAPFACRVTLRMRDGSVHAREANNEDFLFAWDDVATLARQLCQEWKHPGRTEQFTSLYHAIDRLRTGAWNEAASKPLMNAIWMDSDLATEGPASYQPISVMPC